MPASNAFRIHLGLQTAKGTPATFGATWFTLENGVTGADLGANADIETRATMGLGRLQGDQYIRLLSASGGFNVLMQPKSAGLLLYGVLGAKAVAASAPGYTHTLTPASDQPYFTIIREFPGFLIERFDDCKIIGMNMEWAAGGDVTAALNVVGTNVTRLTALPAGTPISEQGAPFRMPGMVNTIEGVVETTQTAGNLNIQAAQEGIQTVTQYFSYVEPGQRAIEYGYTQVMTDIARYAKTVYGAAAGTALSGTMYEGTLKFEFGTLSGAGPGLRLDIPRAQFQPVNPTPDTDGSPIRIGIAGIAARPSGGGAELTGTVFNDQATYTSS